jgi:hypothetical protein
VRIVTRLICPILIYSDPDYIFYNNEMTLVFLRNTYVYIPLVYIYTIVTCVRSDDYITLFRLLILFSDVKSDIPS